MEGTEDSTQSQEPPEGVSAPLPKGTPLTLEASIERMYVRYAKTFEELAK